jgi:hypothetical protein
MTLFRVQHARNYTVINNTICRDKRISWKAKGIWLYAFSRPDDWKFHINDLINQSTDGKEAVRSGLKELEDAGYLRREMLKDEEGRYSELEWTFHETPFEDSSEPQSGFPPMAQNSTKTDKLQNSASTNASYPQTGFPDMDNPPLLSTDRLLNTEKQQQSAAVSPQKKIYKCLDDVDIPTSLKEQVTHKYDEPTVEIAVAYIKHPDVVIKTTKEQAFVWACEKRPQIRPCKEDLTQKHREIARNLETRIQSNIASFTACNTYAEVANYSVGVPLVFEYTDPNFKESLEKALLKYQFKIINT